MAEVKERKGRMVPMSQMVEKLKKINAKVIPLQERKVKVDERVVELERKSRELGEKIYHLNGTGSGLAGHLENMEFGATQYRVTKRPDGWNTIEFFNEAGEKVKNPRYNQTP